MIRISARAPYETKRGEMKISSLTNPKIKKIVRLKTKKARQESGLAVIDGIQEVIRAQEAGIPFEELFYCPTYLERFSDSDLLGKMQKWSKSVFEVTEAVFQKMSYGDRNEGVLALIKPFESSLAQISKAVNGLYLIVDKLEKPGNLGAIIRTCDAAGVAALLVSDPATDLFNPNVIRASLGTVFSVPVICADSAEIQAFLKSQDIRVLASSPMAQTDYTQAVYSSPVAIVIGSEHEGLSSNWIDYADEGIKIPMLGKGDSLNASVSAAILIYEALRQIRR